MHTDDFEGSTNGKPDCGNVDVEELIQQREDAFFKEISTEPSLRKGHPLTHLVTSRDKIENASRRLSSVGDDGTGFGGSSVRAPRVGASPYSVPLQVVDVKDDEIRHRVAKKKRAAEAADRIAGTSVAMSRSSTRHRDFLIQTLRNVQHQLTTPHALKSFIDHHTKRVTEESTLESSVHSIKQSGRTAASD